MRSLAVSVLALALFAPSASAAEIDIELNFCGCDPSSGDEDTRTLVVRAAPGEANRLSIRTTPRGVLVTDAGAALAGRCRPARSGGRFCRGPFEGGEVQLGDGHDTIEIDGLGALVEGGPGDDDIAAAEGNDRLTGGPGADVLGGGPGRDEAGYLDSETALRLTIGDGPGDGAAGEGDDIHADIEDLAGGRGDDLLVGDDGGNRLYGSAGRDTLLGGAGADRLLGSDDGDLLDPGPGSDRVRAQARDRLSLDDGGADRTDCGSEAPAIEADSLDTFRACAPRVYLDARRGPAADGALRVSILCDRDSTVPCTGRLALRLRGRPVSRAVRFGPIPPGRRQAVTLRLRGGPLREGSCLRGRAVTTRRDVPSSTVSIDFVRCRV